MEPAQMAAAIEALNATIVAQGRLIDELRAELRTVQAQRTPVAEDARPGTNFKKVDFGKELMMLDRADWVEPILVRK